MLWLKKFVVPREEDLPSGPFLDNKKWVPAIYLYNPLFFFGVAILLVGLLLAVRTDSYITA